MPKIGGRFEYDPESGQLEVWSSTGSHQVFATTVDGDDILRFMRGAVPIAYTGGRATKNSNYTWAEQLAGLSPEQVAAWERDSGRTARAPSGAAAKAGLNLNDVEMDDLLKAILS